ncbi:MAG: hypothetical protein OEY89_10125 [Gammaproteobacteria bacterium]|nr:hypothetical protein [Gammaproteobacteria bacterium]
MTFITILETSIRLLAIKPTGTTVSGVVFDYRVKKEHKIRNISRLHQPVGWGEERTPTKNGTRLKIE